MMSRDDELRDLLRQGDPADDGSELTRAEAAELRQVMLRSARTTTPMRWLPLAATAAAAVTAAVLLLPGDGRTPAPEQAPSRISGSQDEEDDTRQIRFATENGTQIIWVLDPDLEL